MVCRVQQARTSFRPVFQHLTFPLHIGLRIVQHIIIVVIALHGWRTRSLKRVRPCMVATMLGRLAPETWIWKHITSAVSGLGKIIMRALYKGLLFRSLGRTMECFETEERSSLLIPNYSLVHTHHMYVSTKCRAVGHAAI